MFLPFKMSLSEAKKKQVLNSVLHRGTGQGTFKNKQTR